MKKQIETTALVQGTREWHNWRRGGIGASEAPSIMGVSPWTSRFELWATKTGLMQPAEPHVNAAAAMRRGTELEPKARALYIERTGIEVTPETFTCAAHPFIKASLDGWNAEKRHILELKCPGKADLAAARKGKVPEKYKWQLAQQYICADALTLDYATYDGDQELVIIPVARDLELEAVLLVELKAFWELVQTNTPPSLDSKDLNKLVKRIDAEFKRLSKSIEGLVVINEILAKQMGSK